MQSTYNFPESNTKRRRSLFASYVKVSDGWCVQIHTGLPLSASVPVETFQDEVRDRQPFTGCQLRCELECVTLEVTQLVSSIDVQPRWVHVKCAYIQKERHNAGQCLTEGVGPSYYVNKIYFLNVRDTYLPTSSAHHLEKGFSSVSQPPVASGCCSWSLSECCSQIQRVSGESAEAGSCS